MTATLTLTIQASAEEIGRILDLLALETPGTTRNVSPSPPSNRPASGDTETLDPTVAERWVSALPDKSLAVIRALVDRPGEVVPAATLYELVTGAVAPSGAKASVGGWLGWPGRIASEMSIPHPVQNTGRGYRLSRADAQAIKAALDTVYPDGVQS